MAANAEYLKTDEVYIQLNQPEIIQETDTIEDNDDHWEATSIKLMLDLYIQNIERFRTPKIKKKSVWIDISMAVGKSPDSCDKKFRNLKQTYIRLLKKRNRNEIAVIKWPYFETFEQIFNINGEYQPEIAQKVQEATTDVAKALLSMSEPVSYENKLIENGESSTSHNEEARKKITKRRFTDFRKVTTEMRKRQRVIEEKLDRLINVVEESNDIQKERNRLFEQFLDNLHQNT